MFNETPSPSHREQFLGSVPLNFLELDPGNCFRLMKEEEAAIGSNFLRFNFSKILAVDQLFFQDHLVNRGKQVWVDFTGSWNPDLGWKGSPCREWARPWTQVGHSQDIFICHLFN